MTKADVIECHPTGKWSAEAAAASALERVRKEGGDCPFLALWIDPKTGDIRYSKTDCKFSDMAAMSVMAQEMPRAYVQRGRG